MGRNKRKGVKHRIAGEVRQAERERTDHLARGNPTVFPPYMCPVSRFQPTLQTNLHIPNTKLGLIRNSLAFFGRSSNIGIMHDAAAC